MQQVPSTPKSDQRTAENRATSWMVFVALGGRSKEPFAEEKDNQDSR
jgi:hypothetical protein